MPSPLDDKYAATVKTHCSQQEKDFEGKCAKSWVQYFKEKYVVDLKREKFLEEMEKKGGQKLPFPVERK